MTNGTINDMEAKRSRGKLFTRPEKPREISITDRNVAHLINLSRLRLCSTAQLAALDGGSSQKVERALLGLWENGFIERPESQVTSRRKEKGSRPLIYGLSRKGALYLRRHGFEVIRPLLDGIDKHKAAGWRFIEHSVGISGFFVQLELAIRGRQDLRILERAEIFAEAPKPVRRVRLDARIPINGSPRRCTVIPDGFFGVRFEAEGEESYFMYEKDRGEMPVTRYRNQYGTYFAKKMATYLEASRQQKHVSDLGIPNFRVLVETTTMERVDQMIDAQRELTDGRGSNIFLFVDEQTLAQSDPLSVPWISGKREVVRITD
jgi:protein involved in plasmid replication-relaxation